MNIESSTLDATEEEVMEPQQPHEALFFVLPYLNLHELVMISLVCPSLRDAVDNDPLLWQDIFVEQPLNLRIHDDALLKITSKAQGRLRTLALMNCVRITDDGLQRVLKNNPLIVKLFVPSCTQLTADGIVRAVKRLTEHNNHSLKSIRLQDIHNTTKDHLQTLYSCLGLNPDELQQPNMYLGFEHLKSLKGDDIVRAIDIEVCPKCDSVRMVFDCPREGCRKKSETFLSACRACFFCIPRCEECGGCNNLEEFGDTACLDFLCLECWLRRPKCNMCNRPYCNRHGCSEAGSNGFICEDCCSDGSLMEETVRTWRNYD